MPLTVQAPDGFHFEFEEVKTARGTKTLGEVPILVCDSSSAAVATYGEEGVKNILDGTSLRVSMQSIARRMRLQGKSEDEIATQQIAFRPGTRQVGQSTPVSRAARAAKQAAEKVDGDALASFLDLVAKGAISSEDLQKFTG
jgi:hypothetical protein